MNKLFSKIAGYAVSRYYLRQPEFYWNLSTYLETASFRSFLNRVTGQVCFMLGTETCIGLSGNVRFEVTNICNLKCNMCPQPHKMDRKKIFMDINLYKRVIDANTFIERIDLFNWGEPLLHPRIVEFVAYAAKKKIVTNITSNAVLMGSHMAKALIGAGLSEITFSVDNVGERYENIRGYSFETVSRNIMKFVNTAHKFTKKTLISVNIVESPDNREGIAEAIKHIESFGVDNVYVSSCQIYSDNIPRRRTKLCRVLYHRIVILSNGDVVPCCVDYEGYLAFGSVLDGPDLKKIFNNKTIKQMRRAMKNPETMPETCRNCFEYTGKFSNQRF